jgi:hypothetical protein
VRQPVGTVGLAIEPGGLAVAGWGVAPGAVGGEQPGVGLDQQGRGERVAARRRHQGDEPRNAPADGVHGLLALEGVKPTELLARGREEVLGYGGEIVAGEAVEVSCTSSGFLVMLRDGAVLQGRRLLIATGLVDELPDIPGVHEQWDAILRTDLDAPVALRLGASTLGEAVEVAGYARVLTASTPSCGRPDDEDLSSGPGQRDSCAGPGCPRRR